MLLSDWLLFFDKTIIALSGGHFEYFFTFSQNNYTCLGSSWSNKALCPICEAVQEHERMDEGVLLDFIDEEEFSHEFEKSSGICIRHLVRIMETFGEHPNLPQLIERQLQKYKFLSYELGEYDRKRAYQFSNEPKGSETDSWKRVIEQFVGKREVFGNKMDRWKGQ